MQKRTLHKLITQSLEIDSVSAIKANSVGFMCRSLILATLPHSKAYCSTYTRDNSYVSLTVQAGPNCNNIPYGTKPRLILAFLCTEAVKTKSRSIYLGTNLSNFMSKLGYQVTGGKNGSLSSFKEQFHSLLNCVYCVRFKDYNCQFIITYKSCVFNKESNQNDYGYCVLTEEFYKEIINRPVPCDLRLLNCLRNDSLAFDIYMWLTYRVNALADNICINWDSLANQFGADYTRERTFKAKFAKALSKIRVNWNVQAFVSRDGLLLMPSLSHIPKNSTVFSLKSLKK